jgi:membrane fusion protein (multidrug efflux system)
MTPATSSAPSTKSAMPKTIPAPKKRRPPYIRAILIAIVLLVAIILTLGYFKATQIMGFMALAKSGAFTPPPTAVTTTVASQSEWQPTLDTIGTVTAINGVTISTDLAGIVDKIAFTSGTVVKAGDLLVHLNTDQEQAQLESAQAQLELARLTLNRDRDLLAKRTVAQQDYDTAQATYRQNEATVDQFRALIARKTLRASFDGVVGIRQVNLGQYLNTGDAVVTLQSFDPIYVNFTLPQQDLSKLGVGQEVELRLDAYSDTVFPGKISAINAMVDQATRNIQVQATLQNSELKLRPGMFAKVSVILPQREPVIALPASSVHYAPYGDSIFIVSDGKDEQTGKPVKSVKEQFVKLGAARGDLISVTSGLKPGDEVVTSGVFRLKSGSTVLINNEIQPNSEASPTPPNS